MFKLSDFGVTRHTTTLANGLRLITFERPGMPLYMEAIFFAGSRFDPEGKDGTAHFAEHVICSKTKKFPTQESMSTFIENFGGGTNAYTSSDVMGIESWLGDPSDLTAAVDTIVERIENPLLTTEDVENERKVIHDEISRRITKPDHYLPILWNELIFQGHSSAHSVLGTHETLDLITPEDIRKFHQQFIQTGNGAVIASGGIKIQDIQREFESRLTGKFPANFTRPAPITPRGPNIATKRFGDTDRVYFNFGFLVPPKDHPDKIALDLLADILAGSMSSILMKKLRLDKGLVYGVGAGTGTSFDRGSWLIQTSCAKDKLQEVLDIIIKEVGQAHSGNIEESRLELVKNHDVKAVRFDVQTSEAWINRNSFIELFYPDKDLSLPHIMNEEAKVTIEDVKRVAKKYLVPGKWYLAATGDVEEKDIQISY